MGFEDEAEDLNDPAVKAQLDAFVKNRHYRMDTYRVQDGCANCQHVFVRREYNEGDELYCTFRAPERPPCMSVLMGESNQIQGRPWGYDEEGAEKWEEWKTFRCVVPQGICGEWAPTDAITEAKAEQQLNESTARASTAIDAALSFVEASNKRIAEMENGSRKDEARRSARDLRGMGTDSQGPKP